MVNPGPEAELLLCCARIRMDSKNAARITVLLRQELNWDYLLTLAQYHGVLPLIYWHLRATWPEAVPAVSLDDLRDHFHANAQYNLLLTGALLKLLRLFEAHNIPAMPFKGPVLTAMAYGNITLRQFSDMDQPCKGGKPLERSHTSRLGLKCPLNAPFSPQISGISGS